MAALLGVTLAVPISCGSSGKGLIPTGNAGPLKGDFAVVAQAAQNGNGSCAATEAKILKTEEDFGALPSTVDRGLRKRLREGISKLREDALALCKQPLPQATATSTSKTAPGTETIPTTPTVQTTSTETTPTTSIPTPSGPGGGTPAPGGEAGEESPGSDKSKRHRKHGHPGGTGPEAVEEPEHVEGGGL